MTDSVPPADRAPGAALCGCGYSRRGARLTLLAIYPETFRDAPQRPSGTQTRSESETVSAPLYERPNSPGVYDLYTPADEGAYWAARLALSTDGAWKVDDPALVASSKTGANGDGHADDASTSFKDCVRDLVRESRDSDDLLIALDILLGEDCHLRPAIYPSVPACCSARGVTGGTTSGKHD